LGFIGTNLVRLALAQGHHVLNVDAITYAGNPRSLADIADHDRYQFSHTDITASQPLQTVIADFAPQVVIHLAAESHVDRSIDGPGQFIQTNIVGTFNLLQASVAHWRTLDTKQQNDFRFLHVSTDEVYGSLSTQGFFTESTSYAPRSPYSASKASSDHLARAWHETYGLPVLVTHCGNNYGPYQFPEKLIPVVILKCLTGDAIPVYGTGKNIRDWLYVADHCQALLAVAAYGCPGQTYNIGGNNELTNLQLIHILCQLLDELRPCPTGRPHTEKIEYVADRPGHDFRYAIDNGKMKRELQWQPQENTLSGFRKTVQWYLNNESWWRDILNGSYKMDRIGKLPK
jgi:dTDP-glucose 4,6-dehydratase